MTQKTNKILAFSLQLGLIFIVAFPFHAFIQHQNDIDYFQHLLIPSYLINYLMVVMSFAMLIFLQKKYTNSLGFLFLGGSFVKFAVFLIFFSPYYKQDNEIETAEFFAFFLPYSLGLTLETMRLVKILNRA